MAKQYNNRLLMLNRYGNLQMPKAILSAMILCTTGSSAFATVKVSSVAYGLAAPVHTDVLVDFDHRLPKGFTLAGGLIQDTSNSSGAEPAGDTTAYLSANPGDPAELMSASGFRKVSLYWGSIDGYNTITLLGKDGKSIQSFTGLQVFAPANGNQSVGSTNRRVTFTTSGLTSAIYGLEFQSTSPAFEVDNIAFMSPVRDCKPIGSVPEPSTWAMMIGGLGLVGSSLRRSKKQESLELAHA